jgi:5-methylcytosine-specific restriction endonuclease McrA
MKLLWKTFVRGMYKSAGLDSPYSAQDYGVNWTRQRNKCLERDDYTCRVCDTHQSEIGREPAVHHITPRSQFEGTPRAMNALNNLVTLCPECHGTLEGKYDDCDVDEFVEKACKDNI